MGNTGVKNNCELPEGSCAESLKKVLEKEGISNYSIHVGAGSNKGDNYSGSIYRIVVTGTDRNDQPTKLSLIMKYATRMPSLRDLGPHAEFFGCEAYMYGTVLPALRKMDKTLSFQEVPKLYFASTTALDEYLIFADKIADGFVMADRKIPLDWNHCTLVVTQLANYHAMSFVLKKRDYKTFEDLATPLIDNIGNHKNFRELWMSQQDIVMNRAAKSLDPIEDATVLARYKKFGANLYETMFKIMARNQVDDYCIITHGDCWNNNFLFKYGDQTDPQKPTSICFLDWQISRWASPVFDLSYLVYNCTGTQFRHDHFDELIDFYYDKLSEAIKRMGCDVEELYPRNVYREHMNKFFCYGVSMCAQIIHLITSEAEEMPNLEDMNVVCQEEIDKWHYESKNKDVFNERMSGIIKHAVAHNFI